MHLDAGTRPAYNARYNPQARGGESKFALAPTGQTAGVATGCESLRSTNAVRNTP